MGPCREWAYLGLGPERGAELSYTCQKGDTYLQAHTKAKLHGLDPILPMRHPSRVRHLTTILFHPAEVPEKLTCLFL